MAGMPKPRLALAEPSHSPKGVGLLPVTITRPELLVGGSDRTFRRFIYDLHTLFRNMDKLRDRIGSALGLTGNQFHILLVLAELQEARAVTVKAIAEALQTSGTYVTKETSGLEQRGLLKKSVNPEDRREVIVSLTPKGRAGIKRIAGNLPRINDRLFEGITAGQIENFRDMVALMLDHMEGAMEAAGEIRKTPRKNA